MWTPVSPTRPLPETVGMEGSPYFVGTVAFGSLNLVSQGREEVCGDDL